MQIFWNWKRKMTYIVAPFVIWSFTVGCSPTPANKETQEGTDSTNGDGMGVIRENAEVVRNPGNISSTDDEAIVANLKPNAFWTNPKGQNHAADITIEAIKSKYKLQGTNAEVFAKVALMDSLDLEYRDITSIEPLTGMINLRNLYLPNNNIEKIDAVSTLVNLKMLDLSNNNIKNLDPIKSLSQLKGVDLSDNEIVDISPLGHAKNLVNIILNNNKVQKVEPLKSLLGLKTLEIADNDFTDIDQLKGLGHMISMVLNPDERNKFSSCPVDGENKSLAEYCEKKAE